MITRRIVLASRPGSEGPTEDNFALTEAPLPELADGEVLLETQYLSLDPYMRARMYEGANYAAATALGEVMPGGTVSRVVRSRSARLPEGRIVTSRNGWQTHHVCPAEGLETVDPALGPVSTALGVLGLPGHTGYGGMIRYGRPQPGETVLVSAASGAVGSVAGQVARIRGARVVGIAGGAEKCRYLTEELGFAAAVDHKVPDLPGALRAACPDGIDVYFDNVGGEIFAAVIPLLNARARVAVCGTIAVDRNQPAKPGIDRLQELHSAILIKQLTLQGFLFDMLGDMQTEFRRDVSAWIRSGELKYREHMVEGIEAAPRAFLGLFRGENFGKLIVHMSG